MKALAVFLAALGTALATGLGVFPVLFLRGHERKSLALSGSLAAGFMLGASAGLFYEGWLRNPLGTLAGAAVGVAFIAVTSALLSHQHEIEIGSLRGARGLTALLVIGVMTVHSFTEGVAVGVSFAGEQSLGILIAIAIAVHNIPEGVAISLALVPHGESAPRAAAWSIFTSLPQPLMALPAYLAVRTFEPLLPAGLGFAGGAMVWMVASQLLPESLRAGSRTASIAAIALSMALMIGLELAIGF